MCYYNYNVNKVLQLNISKDKKVELIKIFEDIKYLQERDN